LRVQRKEWWYTPSKAKYLWETDSEQVPWGKDEKYSEKRVKRAWSCWNGRDLRRVLEKRADGRSTQVCIATVLRHQRVLIWDQMAYYVRYLKLIPRSFLHLFVVGTWCSVSTSTEIPVNWHGIHVYWIRVGEDHVNLPVLKHGPRSLIYKRG